MAESATSLFRSTAARGRSMAALTRDSGDGTGPVDFCIPCNPYFPTPAMFDELAGRLREIITYYPSDADTVTAELCELLQLPPQCVAMGNGSTELITWIDHLLVRESLAVPVPTFGRWTDQPMETGKRVDMFPLQESSGFTLDLAQYAEFIRKRGTRVAVVCNPNNPDGGFVPRQTLVQFMDAMADLDLVVIDESFLEFAEAENESSVVQDALLRPNAVVLRSLGKNFGLHGVRFGYLVANPALAHRIRSALPKWNLNSLAEQVVFMLREHGAEYLESLHQVRRDRLDMSRRLSQLPGLTVYPSQGNFLFVRLPVGAEGTVVRDRLLSEHRILVRECGNTIGSSSRFLRLVVRPQVDVRRLVSALEQVLYGAGKEAAVPGPGAGTAYSSGTAAVDRLVSETNGTGLPGIAAQAAAMPQPSPGPARAQALPLAAPVPAPAPAAAAVAPMSVPAAPAPPPAPVPTPAPMAAPVALPIAAPMPAPVPPSVPAPAPMPAPTAAPLPAQVPPVPAMPPGIPPAYFPQPGIAQVPAAGLQAVPGTGLQAVPGTGLQAVPGTGLPGLAPVAPNRRGMPAAGGLTAAQVRGRTQPEPAPEPLGWPAAGGMYNQVG
ncbi:aminotransferase class I/II-fold pyridoxal phosphate-dependent enzyme [Streptomyces sp. NPDC096198]|uniref:pyridoxal phosphate-dependent aminotransferase n=1 Tax=Streptomyces sp. NPDC096198 TaxID=3366080 RepID=UPI00381B3E14